MKLVSIIQDFTEVSHPGNDLFWLKYLLFLQRLHKRGWRDRISHHSEKICLLEKAMHTLNVGMDQHSQPLHGILECLLLRQGAVWRGQKMQHDLASRDLVMSKPFASVCYSAEFRFEMKTVPEHLPGGQLWGGMCVLFWKDVLHDGN